MQIKTHEKWWAPYKKSWNKEGFKYTSCEEKIDLEIAEILEANRNTVNEKEYNNEISCMPEDKTKLEILSEVR